jgi:hypothetical protein
VIPEVLDCEDLALAHRVNARRLYVRLRPVARAKPDNCTTTRWAALMKSVISSKRRRPKSRAAAPTGA